MSEEITLTIDGQEVTVPAGTTLLEAAQQLGIEVPTICYHPSLTANAVCRMCVVEAEGARVLLASCVAECTDGLVVQTRSERVERSRRTIIEMLDSAVDLSEAPDINQIAPEYGADLTRFEGGKRREFDLKDDNPFYVRDYSQCVMCWRCVQVCAEDAQYTYAINFSGRGFNSSIGTFFDKPIPQTTCVFCGQCVGVCPTGALKGKREFLFEQGVAPEEIFQVIRRNGRNQRSVKGPHLDRGG